MTLFITNLLINKFIIMNNISPFIGITPVQTQIKSCNPCNMSSSLYEKSRFVINQLKKGKLIVDQTPHYYLYKIISPNFNIVSLIASIPLNCYKNGFVLPHEMTLKYKELEYKNALLKFKIQISPVLVIHKHDEKIHALLRGLSEVGEPCNYHLNDNTRLQHLIWRITKKDIIDEITNAYEGIKQLFLADGHHRISAISDLLHGDQGIMSMLTSCELLNMGNIGKGMKSISYPTNEKFFDKLNKYFHVEKTQLQNNARVLCHHQGLIYIDRQWYLFALRENLLNRLTDQRSVLHSVLLEYIFGEIFSLDIDTHGPNIISLPYNDTRSLEPLVDSGEVKLIFCTPSLLIQDLLVLSSDAKLFPPQSTYFEPKPIDGLIMNAF